MAGMKPDRIGLGDLVRDRITGFEGIVIGRTEWLRGCDRVTVQGRELHDGKPTEPVSFDVPDVELVQKSVVERDEAPPERKTGGPRPTPTRGRS